MLTHACGKDKYHLDEGEREPLNSPEDPHKPKHPARVASFEGAESDRDDSSRTDRI
jgi:hypothetical protein